MTEQPPYSQSTIEEPAQKLVQLCSRAFAKQKPILLMVQYEHELDKINFIRSITAQLKQNNLNIHQYDIDTTSPYTKGGLYNEFTQDSQQHTLSLVTSWPLSPDFTITAEFLTYMNLHRDLIGTNNLHLVLFIHKSHMAQITYNASDLKSYSRRIFRLVNSPEQLWQIQAPRPIKLAKPDSKETIPQATQQEVEHYIQRSRQLLAQQQSDEDSAQVLFDISQWLFNKLHIEKALEFAIECREFRHNQQLPELIALEIFIGLAFKTLKQYKKAQFHLEDALILTTQNDIEHKINILRMLIELYRENGEGKKLDDVLELYYKLIENLPAGNMDSQVFKTIELFIKHEEFTQALDLINISIDKLSDKKSTVKLSDEKVFFSIHLHIAKCIVLQKLGQFEQAEYWGKKALSNCSILGAKSNAIDCLMQLSLCSQAQNDSESALKYLSEAKKLAIDNEKPVLLCEVMHFQLDIIIDRGDYKNATDLAFELQSVSRSANLPNYTFESYLALLFCEHKQNNLDKAQYFALEAYNIAINNGLTKRLEQFEEAVEKMGMFDELTSLKMRYEQQQLHDPKI